MKLFNLSHGALGDFCSVIETINETELQAGSMPTSPHIAPRKGKVWVWVDTPEQEEALRKGLTDQGLKFDETTECPDHTIHAGSACPFYAIGHIS